MDQQPTELQPNLKTNERTKKRSFVFWFVLFLALVALDQLTKYLVFHWRIAKSFQYFGFFPFRNFGLLFGLHLPQVLVLPLYGAIAALVLWYVISSYRTFSELERLAWSFIVAGGMSNFIERLLLGSVRDFLLLYTGIFNLADFSIILGILILLFTAKPHKLS